MGTQRVCPTLVFTVHGLVNNSACQSPSLSYTVAIGIVAITVCSLISLVFPVNFSYLNPEPFMAASGEGERAVCDLGDCYRVGDRALN